MTKENQHISISEYKDEHIYSIEIPPLLSEIPDKPKKLYAIGNKDILFDPSLKYLCIVGSRRYSAYGHDAVSELIRSLKGKPVAIVSGLALGIDSIAHKTALEVGLPCIAVPGSGLSRNILYPRTHLDLAERIVKEGGVLVSEFDNSMRATPWSFPMRNRIMAGLSHAVCVIEGEEDSGTLITARLALDYNRDVCALPGSIFSETSKGPLSLIKNGAYPICNSEDLHKMLHIQKELILHDDIQSHEEYIHEKTKSCSQEELHILGALKEPKTKQELLLETNIESSKLSIALYMLELRGLIFESCGAFHKIQKIDL